MKEMTVTLPEISIFHCVATLLNDTNQFLAVIKRVDPLDKKVILLDEKELPPGSVESIS